MKYGSVRAQGERAAAYSCTRCFEYDDLDTVLPNADIDSVRRPAQRLCLPLIGRVFLAQASHLLLKCV